MSAQEEIGETFELRVEISGLCFFALVRNHADLKDGIHAILINPAFGSPDSEMTHKAMLFVDNFFLDPTTPARTHKYTDFPLGDVLRLPGSDPATKLPDFLPNLTKRTNKQLNKKFLKPGGMVTAVVPLPFGDPTDYGLSGPFKFQNGAGQSDDTEHYLAWKFAYGATVTGNSLKLALPAGEVPVYSRDGLMELRIKNMPPSQQTGDDPIYTDVGEARHFVHLYDLLDAPVPDRVYPVPARPRPRSIHRPESTLYTCMPGGGS